MLSSKKAPCYLLYFESGHALDPIGDSFNEARPGGRLGGVFEFSSSPLIRHLPQTPIPILRVSFINFQAGVDAIIFR